MKNSQNCVNRFAHHDWKRWVVVTASVMLFCPAMIVFADDWYIDGSLTVTNDTTLLGTNNIAPNQLLLSTNSLLTVTLGDGRYPTRSVIQCSTLIDSEGTNNPPRSLGYNGAAVGAFALVTGNNSVALGRSTYVSGNASVAMNQGAVASGNSAVAMNGASTASGNQSVAMGFYSQAYGLNSVSMGDHSLAWGENSVAMGKYTKSQGFAQLVIGQHNIPSGVETSWASTNIIFMIGNGADTNNLSNAFEITGEGNTWMAGTLSVTSNATFEASVGIGTNSPAATLHVNGTSQFETNAVFNGPVLIVVPQGDLSMGVYTNSPPS